MKSNQKKALIAIAIAGGALLALKNADAISQALGTGSLGGEDDMSQDNPFNFFDPNSTPSPEDGSPYNPNEFDPYTPHPSDPYTPTYPSQPSPTIIEGSDGTTYTEAGYQPAWWDNPLMWGAGMAAGYAAFEGGRNLLKTKDAVKSPKTKELSKAQTKGKVEPEIKETVKTPRDVLESARLKTDVTSSTSRTNIAKTGKMKVSEPIAAKPRPEIITKTKTPSIKGGAKGSKAIGIAGTALAIGQIGAETTQLWHETKPTNVKEGAGVVAAGTVNWLSDAFAFVSGLVYRPSTKNKRYEEQNTGWFATFKDLSDLGAYHRSQEVDVGRRILDVTGLSGFVKQQNNVQSVAQATPLMTQSGVISNVVQELSNSSQKTSSSNKKASYTYNPSSKTIIDNKSGLSYQTTGQVSNIGGKYVVLGVRTISSSSSSKVTDNKGKVMTQTQIATAGQKGSNYVKITRRSGVVEYVKK